MAEQEAPAARAHEARTPDADTGIWRDLGKWAVAFLLFCALLGLYAALILFQLTAEGASKRTLRRAVAALTEVDALVERHYDELQRDAQNAGPEDRLRLEDFPVDVPLTRQQVMGASREDLRDLLLDASADRMYRSGTEPLRSSAEDGGEVGVFSVAGLTDNGLDFLRRRNHDILALLTYVLAGVCVVLGVSLAALCRGFGRLASVGAVVLAASLPLLLAGIGARFYMRIVADGDTEYVEREFLSIGQGLAWIPIRDGIAFSLLGLLFLAAGVALAVWADRRATPRYHAARPYAR